MKKSLMIVDHAISTRESLRWIFKEEPYHLFAFDRPLDALSALEKTEFAVVITEQSMPGMEGIEFLKKVKAKSPYTLGIIMTGYIALDKGLDAIESDYVYQFVKKPIEGRRIKQAVEMAIAHYEIELEGQKLKSPA